MVFLTSPTFSSPHAPPSVSYKIMRQRIAAEVVITIWFLATISSREMGKHRACFSSLGKEVTRLYGSREPRGLCTGWAGLLTWSLCQQD